MAIACGNTFILKPSEQDPNTPMKLAELFLEAGAPKGLLNVLHGGKDKLITCSNMMQFKLSHLSVVCPLVSIFIKQQRTI